jgi:uncharacterized protein Yka (UPF0111/DUF47 family)
MDLATVLLVIVVTAVIVFQFYFFRMNFARMKQFGQIFQDHDWTVVTESGDRVSVRQTESKNRILHDIISSINKYLNSLKPGTEMHFDILKDAVDRNCDAVEEEINAQMPVPLYCGLVGTIFGVIIGLGGLYFQGSIKALLTSSGADATLETAAASGVTNLLVGIAIAMTASFIGIILTTIGSVRFKTYKQEMEKGKNSFMVWMQSQLLPAMPTELADVMERMVRNLNRFNNNFSQNISQLNDILAKINVSYSMQAEILKNIHDMDVLRMAQANVKVLAQLQECVPLLESFNDYLHEVKGYTEQIHAFEQQFDEEANRIGILQEIRDFFQANKGSMLKTANEVDVALQSTLENIKSGTNQNALELKKALDEQSTSFKEAVQEERDTFSSFNADLKNRFEAQIKNMPAVVAQLNSLSELPGQLRQATREIQQSNQQLVRQFQQTLNQLTSQMAKAGVAGGNGSTSQSAHGGMPLWMKVTGAITLAIIALASILTTLVNVFMYYGM